MTQKILENNQSQTFTASFQQKSTGVSLVIVTVVAINYFVIAYELAQSGAAIPVGAGSLALTTIIFISIVAAVLQTVLVIGAGGVDNEPVPNVVTHKANRNGYVVLVVGVLITFSTLFSNVTLYMMANVALLSFVIAEIVRLASQLVYWRLASAD